jgi:hypothetical protein
MLASSQGPNVLVDVVFHPCMRQQQGNRPFYEAYQAAREQIRQSVSDVLLYMPESTAQASLGEGDILEQYGARFPNWDFRPTVTWKVKVPSEYVVHEPERFIRTTLENLSGFYRGYGIKVEVSLIELRDEKEHVLISESEIV